MDRAGSTTWPFPGSTVWRLATALLLLTGLMLLVVVAWAPAPRAQGDQCAELEGMRVPAESIGLPTTGATVQTSELTEATATLPAYCRADGIISPVDPTAPNIRFRVNLPTAWNGRAMHFGGGGFNGTVVAATGGAPSAPPGTPVPLARGYATFGSDSGHDGGNASFALNHEALVNFGYAALKKTHDVAVSLMAARYGRDPAYMYFVGSSQGGREAVTVAQRFPGDYDGVLSRVPVLNFTALQMAGNRMGTALLASTGGWMNAAETALLTNATFAACDARDGVEDGIISKYEHCNFQLAKLRCRGGADTGDHCLSDAQIAAARLLRSPLKLDFPLANGVRSYPGWPVGHEAASWGFWVMGASPPPAVQPPGTSPGGGGIVNFGAQTVRYLIAQDPAFQTYDFDPNDPRWRERIQEVSAIVDSTDPDLAAFAASGGKLIIQEHMGDYAQSPFAGVDYFKSVVATLGKGRAHKFMRLYVSPGADHGGANAPSQVDWVSVLEKWVEGGKAPRDLVMGQPGATRTRPACRYPEWPRYLRGDPNEAESFRCMKAPGFRGKGG